MMISLNLTQNINDANASGRGYSSASWNNYSNASLTSKKEQDVKSGQCGRSMIEMLGVLAIIGVLSVGGIAGYSKAMQKYRINKAIEQITLIVGNIRTFFAPQNSYEGLSSDTGIGKSIIKKAKLVPDEMLEYNSDGTIKSITNAFGGDVQFDENYEPKSLRIIFSGVSESECIELLMHDWSNLSAPSHTSFMFTMKEGHYLCWAKYPVGLDDATKICGFVENFGIIVDADINGESLSADLYHGDCLGYIE